jgi:hypothetical protein
LSGGNVRAAHTVYACANANDEHMLVSPCVMSASGVVAEAVHTSGWFAAPKASRSMFVVDDSVSAVVVKVSEMQFGHFVTASFKYAASVNV